MFKRIITALGGNPTARDVKRYEEIAALIDAREAHFQMQSDAELRAQTGAFRQQLAAAGAAAGSPAEQLAAEATVLDEILVDAFAVVREATVRTLGLRHYPAQLVGGQVLHAGRIAEMRTGEGKTLVATLPLYLNALSGRGVHLVTVNDYLARRDARWMGPVFHFLGLNVGILQDAARTDFAQKAFMYAPDHPSAQEDSDQMLVVPRRDAYHADIIYGTNNEFGFDYLRDNISNSLAERRQRAHFFAIVDEVDNVLIDSARTPLIISGPAQDDPRMYEELARVVRQLRPEHFEIDERNNSISLQDEGYDRIAELLGRPLRDAERPEEVTPEQAQLLSHAEQALRAEFLYKRNKDYLVQAGRVVIVDDFTGRVMPGRRWSDGLHQAVEAKEGVKVQAENVTYATITLQNYFRLYPKLAGMSGTAVTEAEEFNKIYKLDVVPIPTHLDYRARHDPDLMEVNFRENGGKFSYIARRSAPDKPLLHRRKDYDDLVFRTEEAKLRALTRDVLARHAAGQPMLIGTTSVEASEQLSHRLRAEELKKVALVLLLRARWFSVNKKEEDGRAIAELAVLMPALDDLKTADLRPLARELEMRLNPVDADNLKLLAELLQLNPDDIDRLATVLEGGIVHQVLNAKHHDSESQIIARAGALGAVTIATNMAGRGVDIKLGGEIPEQTLGNVNRVLKRAGKPDPSGLSNPERADALRELDAEQLGIYAGDAQAFLQHLEDEHKVRELGGLQIAARRPPQLRAVISVAATDDRYADDVHYRGGCLMTADMPGWAATMLAYNARPPDPRFVGERWRSMWLDRLEHTPPYIEAWLTHQRRDEYWQHGSVCEDPAAIECPVYLVGGWADGYSNTVLRLLAALRTPSKALIGPWPHEYAMRAVPGPQIGFMQECLRWWDHWLKGKDTGIMAEPRVRVWMQESIEPCTHLESRLGRWVAEDKWPPQAMAVEQLHLQPAAVLAASPVAAATLHIRGLQSTGLDAGVFFPMGNAGDLPADQRATDGQSLCFNSQAARARTEILGYPELSVELAADQPQALLAARLCAVAPDGASLLVSSGQLNLAHRSSHLQPEALRPGQRYTVRMQLSACAHALPAGHHWRLALSPTYALMAWPSPVPVTLTVFTGADTWLRLPLRAAQARDAALAPFEAAECAPPLAQSWLRPAQHSRTLQHDAAAGTYALVDRTDEGRVLQAHSALVTDEVCTEHFEITEGDPLSARRTTEWRMEFARGAWQTHIETQSSLSCDATHFHASNTLQAFEGGQSVFRKQWNFSVARDCM